MLLSLVKVKSAGYVVLRITLLGREDLKSSGHGPTVHDAGLPSQRSEFNSQCPHQETR